MCAARSFTDSVGVAEIGAGVTPAVAVAVPPSCGMREASCESAVCRLRAPERDMISRATTACSTAAP